MSHCIRGELDARHVRARTAAAAGTPGAAHGWDVWMVLGDENVLGNGRSDCYWDVLPTLSYAINRCWLWDDGRPIISSSAREMVAPPIGPQYRALPSAAYAFVNMYARRVCDPRRRTVFVPCGQPGAGFATDGTATDAHGQEVILNWRADVPGNLLDYAIDRTREALEHDLSAARSGITRDAADPYHRFVGFIWHSAADAAMSETDFAACMRDMVAKVRASLPGGEAAVFLAGTPTDWTVNENAGPWGALAALETEVDRCAVVSASGLPYAPPLPVPHEYYVPAPHMFASKGCILYGARMFSAYTNLVAGPVGLDEASAVATPRGILVKWSAGNDVACVRVSSPDGLFPAVNVEEAAVELELDMPPPRSVTVTLTPRAATGASGTPATLEVAV